MNRYSSKSDQDIILEILDGNQELFRVIIDRYQNMVAGLVMNMVEDKNTADEVGQEVFVRLFRSLNKFKGNSELGTYIGRIAINLSLNELKQKQVRNQRYDGDIEKLANYSSSENAIEQFETRELMRMALSKLNPNHRSVIVLRHLEGFSTKETASILNLPQGTILSRLSRGQEKLKEALEKLGFNI